MVEGGEKDCLSSIGTRVLGGDEGRKEWVHALRGDAIQKEAKGSDNMQYMTAI